MSARSLFFVSAGLLCLAAAFHLGARSVSAQAGAIDRAREEAATMADADWWARGLGLGSLAVAGIALALNRLDRRPRVRVYAHRATDRTGGSIFQSAHATALRPDDPAIWPPPRVDRYLSVVW